MQKNKNFKVLHNEISKIDNILNEFSNIYSNCKNSLSNLKNVIYDVLDEMEFYLNINDVKVNVSCDENICLICNERSIKTMLTNIIKNSVESQSREIFINLKKNKKIILTIEDNGVGILNGNLNKVKNDFFTTKSYGTGVGLSICKKVANNHNGVFNIRNSKKGAFVSIEFTI